MSFVKVSVEQGRDRRIYFAAPFKTTLGSKENVILKWHSDFHLKDTPVEKLPLPEPGKYRLTYMGTSSCAPDDCFIRCYAPSCTAALKEEIDVKEDNYYEAVWYCALFHHEDAQQIHFVIEYPGTGTKVIEIERACVVLELIR